MGRTSSSVVLDLGVGVGGGSVSAEETPVRASFGRSAEILTLRLPLFSPLLSVTNGVTSHKCSLTSSPHCLNSRQFTLRGGVSTTET